MIDQNVDKNLISTIKYFAFFKYPPNFEEIYTFCPVKIDKLALQNSLNQLIKKRKITAQIGSKNEKRYTLREYIGMYRQFNSKASNSVKKIKSVQKYAQILSKAPQIRLLGLSGSVSMLNADKDDDIDIFIISTKDRIWTARFIALVVATLMGRRRRRIEKHVNNKICLNLFFDESQLTIPQKKQTSFVAHEVLQMKPRVDRENAYARFLEANKWVFKLFPNARQIIKHKPLKNKHKKGNFVGDLIESLLRTFQLSLILRHKTTEIINDKQLWFFPNDFEKKLPPGIL